MRSKVVAAEMATAAGIPAVICNGLRDRALTAARWRASREGTRFPAREARYSRFKLWLKYAKPSHGTVVVDAGAARALREGGTSPAAGRDRRGRGAFDAGDAVEVADGGGVLIGKGICNYSAAELRRVTGMKSRARCARCCRARPRRPCTATTSCWRDRLAAAGAARALERRRRAASA